MVEYKYNQPYYKLQFSELDEDAVHVISFEGKEEISRLFKYRFVLLSEEPELDARSILNKKATFMITRGEDDPINIYGIISHFQQRGRTPDYVLYNAVLVPKMWRLNLTYQNEIYQNVDIEQLVNQVLETSGFSGEDFEFQLNESYPEMEYVVQYQETNFNFINRRLEHYGIFYFFDHRDDNDVIVFTDSNEGISAIEGTEDIYYNPNKDQLHEMETISELNCKEKVVTGLVRLKDYNYLYPEKQLMAESQIDSEAPGMYYDFGQNFQDETQSEFLARIRNEEILSRSKIFRGNSDCRLFHAGYKFTMDKHYREEWNGLELILTRVLSRGTQRGLFGILPSPKKVLPTYENYFQAIPIDIAYRPPRRTPVPRIPGIMSAKLESGVDDEYAYIDDHGRYRAKMLFDLTDRTNGEATLPLRLSQAYSGSGYGMHFPNHSGTELLWACVDGDVDRPIGLGTVPNPSNTSPSTSDNKAQSVIRTAGQNELTFDDKTGSENILMKATKDHTVTVANDETISVGNDQTITVGNNQSMTIEHDRTKTINHDEKITIQNNRTTEILDGDEKLTVKTGNRIIEINTGKDQLLVKTGDRIIEVSTGNDSHTIKTGNREVDINSGNDTLNIKSGKKTEKIKGPYEITVNSGQFKIVCGQSQLILNHSGLIEIKGKDINIQGRGGDVKISGMNVESSAEISNDTKGAMVMSEAKAMNIIKGGMVQLNP